MCGTPAGSMASPLADLPDPVELLAPLMGRGIRLREIAARVECATATIRAVCARVGWEVPE